MRTGYTTKRGTLIEYDNELDKILITRDPHDPYPTTVQYDRREFLGIINAIEKDAVKHSENKS